MVTQAHAFSGAVPSRCVFTCDFQWTVPPDAYLSTWTYVRVCDADDLSTYANSDYFEVASSTPLQIDALRFIVCLALHRRCGHGVRFG
jgi:hypothetical protein